MTDGVSGGRVAALWEDELPADGLGGFEWNVTDDVWDWSDEQYLLHGYAPGAVEPDADLVIAHKVPEDRRRAERILQHGGTPGFRFHNLHGIVDAHGVERLVLSVGAVVWRLDPDRVHRQVMRGFMKDLTGTRRELLRRLSRVPEGGELADPLVTATSAGQRRAPLDALSERERQVMVLIAAGRSNDEIARELFVSVNTVKTYVRAAYRKIGVQRRSQAILWWLAQEPG